VRLRNASSRITASFQAVLRFHDHSNQAPKNGPARSPAGPFGPGATGFSLRFSVKQDEVRLGSRPADLHIPLGQQGLPTHPDRLLEYLTSDSRWHEAARLRNRRP
jgi:hypothetical protein